MNRARGDNHSRSDIDEEKKKLAEYQKMMPEVEKRLAQMQ